MSDTTVTRLTAADFPEAMDFLNLVFSTSSRPHDFARMLPILYRPTDEHMACNRAVVVKGRIRAIVGVFPMAWQVGGARLRVAGIGGVAVHPADRGLGYMKTLMARCMADIDAGGYDLSWLGGQRQRYQHHGYEIAGTHVQAVLTRANIRARPAPQPLTFEAWPADDAAALGACAGFHDRQPAHTVRTLADLQLRAVSWQHRPWLARRADGTPAGYVVAGGDHRTITEVAAADDATAMDMLAAWVLARDTATIELSPFAPALTARVAAFADATALRPSGNWRIINWAATVAATLGARAASTPLPGGRVVIDIAGQARLAVEVAGSRVRCEPTCDTPCLSADPLTATRLLFGPLRPSQVMDLPAEAALLEAWGPLPLAWRTQDGV